MASYSNEQISTISEIIEDLDLEIFTKKKVLEIAESSISDELSAQEVADSVVDYLWTNNLGNAVMAAGNNLMIDKQTLLNLRYDIMQALS